MTHRPSTTRRRPPTRLSGDRAAKVNAACILRSRRSVAVRRLNSYRRGKTVAQNALARAAEVVRGFGSWSSRASIKAYKRSCSPPASGCSTACSSSVATSSRAFEAEMAAYLGVAHVRGVASGTDALRMAALRRGPRARRRGPDPGQRLHGGRRSVDRRRRHARAGRHPPGRPRPRPRRAGRRRHAADARHHGRPSHGLPGRPRSHRRASRRSATCSCSRTARTPTARATTGGASAASAPRGRSAWAW